MINIFSPFPLHNPNRISIPIKKINRFSLCFILIASFISLFILTISSSSSLPTKTTPKDQEETMKVHPLHKKRNNFTIQFYNQRGGPSSGGSLNKKLRRLPHIFSRVLELPFRSDADVSVEEDNDCFRFVAETDNNIGEVRAHTIEIHPGVTKIVIMPNGFLELSSLDDLELDMWRFRLPETTRPELASAVLADGELIVTVPKGQELEEEGNGNNNNGEFRGGMGNNNNNNNNNARLVLVQ